MALRASLGFSIAAFLGLVACLGRGVPVLSAPLLLCAAGAAAGALLAAKLQQLEKQFVFTDWVNAHK
jgi:hypothetical protein